jgi:hypothetical protein
MRDNGTLAWSTGPSKPRSVAFASRIKAHGRGFRAPDDTVCDMSRRVYARGKRTNNWLACSCRVQKRYSRPYATRMLPRDREPDQLMELLGM